LWEILSVVYFPAHSSFYFPSLPGFEYCRFQVWKRFPREFVESLSQSSPKSGLAVGCGRTPPPCCLPSCQTDNVFNQRLYSVSATVGFVHADVFSFLYGQYPPPPPAGKPPALSQSNSCPPHLMVDPPALPFNEKSGSFCRRPPLCPSIFARRSLTLTSADLPSAVKVLL